MVKLYPPFLNFFQTFILLALFFSSFAKADERNLPLFFIQTDRIDQALNVYQTHKKKLGHHDPELLQEMGLALLKKGLESGDKETEILCLFGAGASLNEQTLPLLENGLNSPYPQIQLISLHLMAKYQNDVISRALLQALRSDSLAVRFEALQLMVEKQSDLAMAQSLALLVKVEEDLWPLFAPFFVKIGTFEANTQIKKFLFHRKEAIRLAAILSLLEEGRDDFLEEIRLLSSHPSPVEQEASVKALGQFKDRSSLPALKQFANSPHPSLALTAQFALYQLGDQEAGLLIAKKAKEGDLFAITLLGKIPEQKPILRQLIQDRFPKIVQLNAALALLQLKDPSCLPVIRDYLISEQGILQSTSKGKGVYAWKALSLEELDAQSKEMAEEILLEVKETILKSCSQLPEEVFLSLASDLFKAQKNALIPTLCALLESLNTKKTITLLKQQKEKLGAPLIRLWCTLTLFRLDEDETAQPFLQKWLKTKHAASLIQLRPLISKEMSLKQESFTLTPEESSRLLIETLETFASKQEDLGLDVLLDTMQSGNPKNRFALAGLLMRAAQ